MSDTCASVHTFSIVIIIQCGV